MEGNSNMTMAFPVTFWLSEHIVLDQMKITSLQEIYELAKDFKESSEYINVPEISTQLVGNVIQALFPTVKTSRVMCQLNGKQIKSFKSISVQKLVSSSQISFHNVKQMKPPDWFVFNEDSTSITFGYTYNIQFNGHNSVLLLTLNDNNTLSAMMDNKQVDLAAFFIPEKVNFTATSLPAIFRSMLVLQPCHGYEIKNKDENSFAQSTKCTKVQRKIGTSISSVLKHENCQHCVPLQNRKFNLCCGKCSQFVCNKKRSKSTGDKENDCAVYHSKEEILDQLKALAPNLHENQLLLIQSQIMASNVECKKSIRWDKELLCMSISLYNRNPASYRELTLNHWLTLPSEQLIKVYKSAVQQKPGIVTDMMLWMSNEAKKQINAPDGYYGGLILDEMAIQEDLQIVHTKEKSELHGLSYTDNDIGTMHALNNSKIECELANHVQQYLFSGLSGFRWPFANFPNTQASPAEIFTTTWLCIEELHKWGFKAVYCCMDGSANNRSFLKMHFPHSDPVACKMIARHYKNPLRKIVFIMDPPHLLKKIRNSILSSGFQQSHQRLLTVDSHFIIWKMFIDAYQWDRTNNSFKIHHKLTDEHIFPSQSQKMRNKLAFDVLDENMLNLMKCYTASLNKASQNEMVGVLEFLKHTSFLVSFFTDYRPIKDISDDRLKSLAETYNWFKSWEKQQTSNPHKRINSLITMETREDLDFMYHGFVSLTEICINQLKTEVVPNRINSDIIENIFCQQRSLYHGANTNPNYNEYRSGINSIILGQTTTSRKSNVGGVAAKPLALGPPPRKQKFLM